MGGKRGGNQTSKRPRLSSIPAPNRTHVPRRTTDALHIIRHGHRDGELLLSSLTKSILSRDIVAHDQLVGHDSRVGPFVQVAGVRSCAVGVDLVDRHVDAGSLSHGRDGAFGECVFGHGADVDVAVELGAAAGVDGAGGDFGVADDGCVHLAGVDGGAVAGDGVVDHEADGRGGISLALGGEDDAVGGDQGREKEGRQRQEGVLGRKGVHDGVFLW